MDPLLWWILLFILILSITVLLFYFCYNLIQDYCIRTKINVDSAAPQKRKLSKYKFEKTDVDDLTSIEKDLHSLIPRVKFVNEVDVPNTGQHSSLPNTPRGIQRRKASLLPDIHENSASFRSLYKIENIMSEVNQEREERKSSEFAPRRYSLVTEGMRRNSLATLPRKYSLMPDGSNLNSTDTLDCMDPIIIETKRAISNVEEDVRKIELEIDYFMGGAKNLKFYEINEKLIRFNIALSDIECTSEELRKRKKEVQNFINECKEKLKSKVGE